MTNGRRRGKGRRGDIQVNAEINVTSLIDVAFTLLVIFIITAPMLQGGIEVRLPQARVQPLTAQDQPFIVSIDEDGMAYVGETPLTPEEFDDAFPQLFAAAQPGAIYLRADGRAFWDYIAPRWFVIAETAREAGVSVNFLAEPEPRR